ncbi:hypothetical protein [Pseudoalteromonas atlantica]|uniref:hypothetical protein n=1 Tax=Pseudoalteromonas atlantica TaxID=288 RepID=UPI000BBCE704|nr:hypothetical protein [Pseudoalteromonas atlantica]
MKTIIHIGPPKTGTSAIQKWLKDHADCLMSNGVYYPEHQQDSNGISSGNFLSVFSAHNGDYVYSPQKLQDTIAKAQAANCHTLLLSSEFFFSRLPTLLKAIPDAQCIAYVRNPAQLHESHYNQSVKRHGNTAVIKRAETLPMHTLKRLGEYGQQLGKKLTLRAYHDYLFVNKSIVCDFLSVVFNNNDIDFDVKAPERVNPGYCLEALEIKRCFNYYELGQYAGRLDRVLQAYDKGIKQFTFVGKHQFNDYKRQSIRWIERLAEQVPFEQAGELVDVIKNQPHQDFFKQEVSKAQCLDVFNFILKKDKDLLQRLALCVYAQPNVEDRFPFVAALFEVIPPRSALPTIVQYVKDAIYCRYPTLTFNSSTTKNTDLNNFRSNVSNLLQVRFSLMAYIKALLAS